MDSSGTAGWVTPGSRRALAHVQRLLAHEPPRRRKCEVGPHERRMLGQPALGRIGQKARDERARLEAGGSRRFLQAALGQRHLVVNEVPEGTADQADVGLQHDHPATRPEDPVDHSELLEDRVPGRQVLQVVAHERHAEVFRRQDLVQSKAIRLNESDVRRQRPRRIPEIGRPPLGRNDITNEVALVAADVDDRPRDHVAPQIVHDRRPDSIFRGAMVVLEATRVDTVQIVAHSRPASSSVRIQGMTSWSIASSVVVASKPSTSRALRTSGTLNWTSCSNGGSETVRNGLSGPWTARQIVSASSRTVVDVPVERLKSSLRARSDSIARRIPWARSPPYV